MANFTLTANDLKDKALISRLDSPASETFTDETVWGTAGVDGLPPLEFRYRKIRITVDGTVVYDTNYDTAASTDVNDWNGTSGESDMDNTEQSFAFSGIPTNQDGSFVQGDYKIEIATLYKTSDAGSTYAIVNNTVVHNLRYARPEAKITTTVDLNFTNPLLRSVDDTVYQVDDVDPTLSGVFQYYPPQGTTLSPVSTSSGVFNLSTFATGTSVFQLLDTNTAVWDFSSKEVAAESNYVSGNFTLELTDKVTKREEFKVQDDIGLCGVICCINSLYDRIVAATGKGDVSEVNKLNEQFNYAMSRVALLQSQQSCGTTENINDIITDIKTAINCGDNCCDDKTPTVISPMNGQAPTGGTVIKFNTGRC